MMKRRLVYLNAFLLLLCLAPGAAAESAPALPGALSAATAPSAPSVPLEYTLGVDDELEINILQPEQLVATSVVAPDGTISVPYIGSVQVKDKSVAKVQQEVQAKLADGYLKYPVVTVALKMSRSRKFFVYGEVNKPGPYTMDDSMTVLRGISMAGGFTRFGSASRVKVLRPQKSGVSYDSLKVDIKRVMDGDQSQDLLIKPGDMIVVSQGLF